MKIALSAFGTEGDVRPVVALAKGLRGRGHEVCVVTSPMYSGLVEKAGVPLRPAVAQVTLNEYLQIKRPALVDMLASTNPYRQTDRFFELHAEELRGSLPQVIEATRDSDVVIHSYLDVSGYVASQVNRKPHVSVLYFHGMLPTSRETYDGKPGTPLSWLQSGLEPWLLAQLTNKHFSPLLKAAGLPPRRSILLECSRSSLLTLLPLSPALYPSDPRWKRYSVVQTGYMLLGDAHYQPPAELEAFMSGPDKPVVINFGSMVSPNPKGLTEAVCRVVRRLGVRAVLQSGWSGLGEGPVGSDILRVGHVPHEWLLPRAAALVHHGGAGTTGAALHAGVPQVVVWFLGDQRPMGDLLFRRRLLPNMPLHHLKLTESWLEESLRQALGDSQLHGRVAAMAERVRAENGVLQAVEAFEAACGKPQAMHSPAP